MVKLLADEPLLLLALVLACGALVGAVQVRGVSLGPAGALVAGLAISAADDRLTVDALVGNLGLSLFTFAVGLASGPALITSLRSNVRLILGVGGILALAAPLTAGVGAALGLERGVTAGMYAGALTNTPALAAARDALGPAEAQQAVVGYALAYLFGVVGMLVAIVLVRSTARRSPGLEDAIVAGRLVNVTVQVSPRRRNADDSRSPSTFQRTGPSQPRTS